MEPDRERAALVRRYPPMILGLVLASLVWAGLAACDPDVSKPVPPMSPTPLPQPTRVGTDADVELIKQARDGLRNLTSYHYEISGTAYGLPGISSAIEGDVVHTEGASMIGQYMGTPVALLVRDDRAYQRKGDAWVTKAITDALEPLLAGSATTGNVILTLTWMKDPIGTPINPFYDFPPLTLRDYRSQHNVYIIGEVGMHETRVIHYEFPSCSHCFGGAAGTAAGYYMASTWIDPATKYVHKYDVRYGSGAASVTISHHNDLTLELPSP